MISTFLTAMIWDCPKVEPQIAAEGAKSPSFANCGSSGQETEKHKNRASGQTKVKINGYCHLIVCGEWI